jgi:hypothetical protein
MSIMGGIRQLKFLMKKVLHLMGVHELYKLMPDEIRQIGKRFLNIKGEN